MQTFRTRGLVIHRNTLEPGRANVIVQVAGCFIVVKCDNMLVIFDQHALHERVRLERFLDNLRPGRDRQQVIRQSPKPFKPLVLPSLSAADLALLQTPLARAFLANFLVEYQIIGTAVLVRTRPCIVEEPLPDVADLLPALLRDLRGLQSQSGAGDPLQALPTCVRSILNSKACRGAVMFHTKLTRSACKCLLREGAETKFPFSCAHGRPSVAPLALLEYDLSTTPRPDGPLRFRLQASKSRKASLSRLATTTAKEKEETNT